MPSSIDYNKLSNLEKMPYNIVDFLFQDETIWKILYYDDPNALYEPNLTNSQKAGLIYSGGDDASPYKVFFDLLTDDAAYKQCTMLRIFPSIGNSYDFTKGTINFVMQILSHVKLNSNLNDPYHATRTLRLLTEIVRTLNGKEIGGLGRLTMNRNATLGSSRNGFEYSLSENRGYVGYVLTMSTVAA